MEGFPSKKVNYPQFRKSSAGDTYANVPYNPDGTTLIYGLIDPNDGLVKYVGKTRNRHTIVSRFNHHINEKDMCPRRSWIVSLKRKNQVPILDVLDVVPESEWQFWEQWWIAQFKAWGFKLKNVLLGGDGQDKGYIPWNKGLKEPYSDEFKKNMRARMKERCSNPDNVFCFKISHEEFERVRDAYINGESITELAFRYNVSPTNLYVRLRRCGTLIKREKKVVTDEMKDKIAFEATTTNKKQKEIAAQFNVSQACVSETLRSRGIDISKYRVRPCSEETRRKMSESNKKTSNIGQYRLGIESWNARPVKQKSLDGNTIKVWRSVNDAKVTLKVKNIYKCIIGERKSAGGFKWEHQ